MRINWVQRLQYKDPLGLEGPVFLTPITAQRQETLREKVKMFESQDGYITGTNLPQSSGKSIIRKWKEDSAWICPDQAFLTNTNMTTLRRERLRIPSSEPKKVLTPSPLWSTCSSSMLWRCFSAVGPGRLVSIEGKTSAENPGGEPHGEQGVQQGSVAGFTPDPCATWENEQFSNKWVVQDQDVRAWRHVSTESVLWMQLKVYRLKRVFTQSIFFHATYF